mgnify:CR=1 FL=1
MYVCVNRSFTWEPLDAETRNKSSKARYCLDHGGGGSKWGPCIFLSPNYWLEPKEAITHYDVYHFCVNCYVFHDFVSWWLAVVNNMLEPKAFRNSGYRSIIFLISSQINQVGIIRYCFFYIDYFHNEAYRLEDWVLLAEMSKPNPWLVNNGL